jgi:hypothetical protein
VETVPIDLELLELFADEPELLALSLIVREVLRADPCLAAALRRLKQSPRISLTL